MPVCQFYLRGTCKFGDGCRNEHPSKGASPFSSRNPFESLGGSNSRGGGTLQDTSSARDKPYYLDKATITSDLSKELPLYILSAYGPGKHSPIQLFGGFPREQSFEELRLRHYELASTGNQQQAILEAQTLVNNAEQQIKVALGDVDGAIKYITNGENEHPNRNDICKAKGANPSYLPGAGGNDQPALSFGQPSSFGKSAAFQTAPQATSTFGRPSTSFGQPSVTGTSFGKPSPLGQQNPPLASAFGQSSAFEKTSSFSRPQSLFGQTNSTPAIGQQIPGLLSTSGQSSNQSPFGAIQTGPSMLGGVSTSVMTQPATSAFSRPNPFGQPSTFGQPSAPAAASGFGQITTPATSSSPGQLTSVGSSAFGRPTALASTTTFGQPTTAKSNPFAQTGITQTSAFGQAPTAPTSLGQTSAPATGFAFGGTTAAQASSSQHNGAQRDPQGRLITWKGKPVSYINDEPCFKGKNNDWEKIWFPDGPPVFNKAVELPLKDYDQATKESYKFLGSHGEFKDGIMPYLPPRREWCSWDF